MSAGGAHRLFSLRGLGIFWAGMLLLAGFGGATLQILGPLPAPAPPARMAAPAAVPSKRAPWEQPLPAPPKPAPAEIAVPPAAETAAPPAATGPDQHAAAAAAPERSEPAREEHPPEPAAAEPPAAPARIAAPDTALMEPSVFFWPAQLPRVAADGRKARTVYAAPAPAIPTGKPRVALMLSGFGLSEKESRAAIELLPGAVGFAVSAYAGNPLPLLDAARAAGHELLASVPMEPPGWPLNDAGERSLRTGLSPEQNRQNLEWALSRTQGAVGATAASDGMRGERFSDVSGAFDPVLDSIARRGLLYIDPRPGRRVSSAGLAARSVDVVVDGSLARAEIEAKLVILAQQAKNRGQALGLAGPLRPVTIELIAAWAKTLEERGVVLVPVSALASE